jgi:solute carrier family 6 GABA transporter-like protein 1
MMITGFILSILTVIVVLTGFVMPRYYDAFIPTTRQGEGTEPTTAMESKGEVSGMPVVKIANAEGGRGGHLVQESSLDGDDKAVKEREPPPAYHAT